ncbi:hypothetical protein HY449_01395 [Candidatus Pacearchaeota archaeon]|nr:hypothetical protein [Candidatus Pacearchaeota archaeon]
MGVLEQISQMRNQGMDDENIVRNLQERGVSPKAINDALNQAEIKKAVSDEEFEAPGPSQQRQYVPRTQEMENQNYQPQEEQPQQEYYSPQQGYADYSQEGGFDTSTIMEVAEQVFAEKMQKFQKQIKDVADFKELANSKMDSLSERMKRIENLIDKMQVEILEKVGSYGKGIENIQKELGMMQDSFGKVINPLADRTSSKMQRQSYSQENLHSGEDAMTELEKIANEKPQKAKKVKKISKR